MATQENQPIDKLLESLPITRSFINSKDTTALGDLEIKILSLGGMTAFKSVAFACFFVGQSSKVIDYFRDSDTQDKQWRYITRFILMGYEMGSMKTVLQVWKERIGAIIEQQETISIGLSGQNEHLLRSRMGFYKSLLGVGVLLKRDFRDPLDAFRRAFEEK